MAANEQQKPDLGAELTLDEAAAILDVHTATARRYIREDKLPAHKVDGPHGREWRIWEADAKALAKGEHTPSRDLRESDSGEGAEVTEALAQIESTVRTDLLEVREGVEAGLRQFAEAHERQSGRIHRGLTSNAEIIRDLAAQVGRLEAERDRLQRELEEVRADRDRLRGELEAEQQRSWWEKLTKNRQ